MADGVWLDPNDDFDKALIDIKTLHDRKKADYSDPNNRFSNFEYSAKASGVTPEQVFEVLISTKQARLIELMKPDREVKNEPLADTLLDRAVYCIMAFVYNRIHN